MGNQIDKVIDGLYVGGLLGASKKPVLVENKITHILAIHDKPEEKFPNDFVYKCVDVSDTSSAKLTPFFSECVEFIHEGRLSGGSVFIHCAAGISRSVTITVLYIMCTSTLNMADSLAVVSYCREMANPNFGFKMQLKKFEENDLEEARKKLVEKYPNSHELRSKDDIQLKELLVKVKARSEQGSGRNDEDPYPFDPENFSSKKSD